MSQYTDIRERLYETTAKAVREGLIRLSAGNLSTRTPDGNVAITPSRVPYDLLRADDIPIIDVNGAQVDGDKRPSSETPMHTAIYRALPHVGAIVHTHSPYAITFATLGQEIPLVTIELFICGAPIPVAPWACPGTPEAGRVAVELFRARPALRVCLLRSHGLVAIGDTLDNAFEMAVNAEVGLQVYHQARQLGTPERITPERVNEILALYA